MLSVASEEINIAAAVVVKDMAEHESKLDMKGKLDGQAVFMLSVASEEMNKVLLNSDRIFELAEFKRRGKGNDRVSALTKFNNAMQHQHLKRLVQDGDGNCFFRSVSFLIYGTAAHYQLVRASICEVIDVRRKHYRHFVPNVDIDLHLSKMAKNKTYADHNVRFFYIFEL